jgi:NTP pyrophosphatase (non-canonical NTP hydrolase)
MNLEEWKHMIEDTVDSLMMQTYAAAERNQYKDQRGYGNWIRGWEGFDLNEKLKEEVAEVLQNPTPKELGDVAWVIAMMLDQAYSSSKKSD